MYVCMYEYLFVHLYVGVGDAIADDAHWFPLSYKEQNAGKVNTYIHTYIHVFIHII